MSAPSVTVLTAVRNGASHLAETIASVRAQTFTDWEYIIVDDASIDETVAMVEDFCQKDRRLRLLRRAEAGGPYVAANQGLREARGRFIVRIDADDLSPADRIQKQYDFLLQNRRFRACVSYWQAYDGSRIIPGTVTTVPLDGGVFCWYLLLRSPSLHSSVCYERSAIFEIGGYRELPLSQDYRLWCELTCRGWLGVMPEVLSYVRTHQKRESLQKRELQRRLALEVLADHLFALTRERWDRADLEALWSVGHSEVMPISRGLEMLERWDGLWKASDLSAEQKKQLQQISAFRRWKHVRSNARRQPIQALLNAARYFTVPWHIVRGSSPSV
ncbi:MAG TPA: glycosyltransferase family 2 protein [Bryobacteraceae bacterium]|nr:glycosyltransferase family 2 protein [Bryobacteraceae bacterium]